MFFGLEDRKIMMIKYIFEEVDMGEEIIIVPVGEGAAELNGVLKVNKEGREILDFLRQETNTEAIVDALAQKYDNERNSLDKYVNQVIDTLRRLNLLTE